MRCIFTADEAWESNREKEGQMGEVKRKMTLRKAHSLSKDGRVMFPSQDAAS